MCLLTFLPPGQMPDTDALLNGAISNNDGHGYAIAAAEGMMVGRGFDAESVIEGFYEARAANLDAPALFHSRFGTDGSYTLDNVHPFYVAGDNRTVVAHNGIMPADCRPGKNETRSDTRLFAEKKIHKARALSHRSYRVRMAKWMTPANKVVVLSTDRAFRDKAYILNEQAGIWHNGIWYSNSGYEKPVFRTNAYYGNGWDTDEHWWNATSAKGIVYPRDYCGNKMCGKPIIDDKYGDCYYCGWCGSCNEMPDDCMCYQPAKFETVDVQRALDGITEDEYNDLVEALSEDDRELTNEEIDAALERTAQRQLTDH